MNGQTLFKKSKKNRGSNIFMFPSRNNYGTLWLHVLCLLVDNPARCCSIMKISYIDVNLNVDSNSNKI
jgi:hypothetical protein